MRSLKLSPIDLPPLGEGRIIVDLAAIGLIRSAKLNRNPIPLNDLDFHRPLLEEWREQRG
jgi:hypothetical protein